MIGSLAACSYCGTELAMPGGAIVSHTANDCRLMLRRRLDAIQGSRNPPHQGEKATMSPMSPDAMASFQRAKDEVLAFAKTAEEHAGRAGESKAMLLQAAQSLMGCADFLSRHSAAPVPISVNALPQLQHVIGGVLTSLANLAVIVGADEDAWMKQRGVLIGLSTMWDHALGQATR